MGVVGLGPKLGTVFSSEATPKPYPVLEQKAAPWGWQTGGYRRRLSLDSGGSQVITNW